MQAFEVNDLIHQASEQNKRSLEFLRVPSMSLGIYRLAAGEPDPQSPHKQDEVYYVLSGKAKLQEESRLQPVQSGSILFVAAGAVHKFVDIEADLDLLVFFAPAKQN